MPELINKTKANFGTMPVFVTAISTILGAILFLRFGYAVGQTGLIGAFAIIILGHLVTIPTALAVAEIATNQKVEGGGDIDKGSEVMQNLMDNLEAGGEVSEESQGLEGAQAMYDQQQMLQSRIA